MLENIGPDLTPEVKREGIINTERKNDQKEVGDLESVTLNKNLKLNKAENIDQLKLLIKDNNIINNEEIINIINTLSKLLKDADYLDSVITSTVLGRKDLRAQNFANVFQRIEDEDTGVKNKVKEFLKTEMKRQFESGRDYYAEKTIARAESIEDLFHIFDQFGANEEGSVVIGGVEKEELKRNIKNAYDDLNRQIEREEIVDLDLQQINFSLSLYRLPKKYNISEQVVKIIKSKNKIVQNNKEPIKKQIGMEAQIKNDNKKEGLLNRLFGVFKRK